MRVCETSREFTMITTDSKGKITDKNHKLHIQLNLLFYRHNFRIENGTFLLPVIGELRVDDVSYCNIRRTGMVQ